METVSGPTFTENPADYLGEIVTAEYQPRHEVRDANGWPKSVFPTLAAELYAGRHRWNVRRRSPRGGAR